MSFWISHLVIFVPFLLSWMILAGADENFDYETGTYTINWTEGNIEFYKIMLLDIVVAFAPPIWLLLVVGFVTVMYQ